MSYIFNLTINPHLIIKYGYLNQLQEQLEYALSNGRNFNIAFDDEFFDGKAGMQLLKNYNKIVKDNDIPIEVTQLLLLVILTEKEVTSLGLKHDELSLAGKMIAKQILKLLHL